MILRSAVEDQQLLEQIAHHQSQMRAYHGNEDAGTYLEEHGSQLDLLLDKLARRIRRAGNQVRTNVSISLLHAKEVKMEFVAPTLLMVGDFADGHTISATPEQFRKLANTILEQLPVMDPDHPDQQMILHAEHTATIEEGNT